MTLGAELFFGRIIGGIFQTKKDRDASKKKHRGSNPIRSDDPDPEDGTDRVFVWRVTCRWWGRRRDNKNSAS